MSSAVNDWENPANKAKMALKSNENIKIYFLPLNRKKS
jgi:hypothetical protein